MQMVKKSILIFFAVWFVLLMFMPKAELYYTLEKVLEKQDIKLNEKSIDEGLFSLSIKDVTVYVKGIALANIEELNFFTILFYNKLSVENLQVDEVLQTKVPSLTKEAIFSHTILAPLTVSVDANGSFGSVEGEISLKDENVHIKFIEAKEIGMLKDVLKKDEKGWFYEKAF